MDNACWLALGLAFAGLSQNQLQAADVHRSPLALAISPDKNFCLTANHTSGSVSLIDVSQRKLLTELPVGRGPVDIVWVNDSTALVSLLHDDAVALIERNGPEFNFTQKIPIGDEPHGITLSKDRHRAFVALGGEDAVAILDLEKLLSHTEHASDAVSGRIAVGGIPHSLSISPDGRWLVTCCTAPCEVFVHDTESLQQISARKIFDGAFNPGIPAVTNDSQIVVLPSAINRAFSVTSAMIDIGWVIDNRLTKLPLPDGAPGDQKQVGLDIRGKAVGDANAVSFSPDNHFIVVTCGGTHELLVLDFSSIPWPKGDPGDFLPESLRKDQSRYRRIKLGGRPVDVQFINQNEVMIANYLADAIQVVDIAANSIVNSIALGGPEEPSLARRGEILFYDADRSFHSWFSCHTCHPDGHTSGQLFDTRNDLSYGTPKLTPSLRGVTQTGPWTWHGWQTDLNDAMRRSLVESMNTEKPVTADDTESLAAFMSTLDHPNNPRSTKNDPTLQLGRRLFEGKAGCVKCHQNLTYTTDETFDGAVDDPKDKNRQYNPPSLRGVSTRRRFLHTGKAKSLEQVLTTYHRPEDLVGESLSPAEILALVDFLMSL